MMELGPTRAPRGRGLGSASGAKFSILRASLGQPLSRFDALAAQLAVLFDVDDALVDGEIIIAADETGRPQRSLSHALYPGSPVAAVPLFIRAFLSGIKSG
jgi:hypothetical protein